MSRQQGLLGAGVMVLGFVFALGSRAISSEAGYGGVGPNFLPLVVGLGLIACGAGLLWEVFTGGFRQMDEPSGAAHGHWIGFAWMTAGILLNSLLIERIGFILACTLCYVLAVRGLRLSKDEGRGTVVAWLKDAAVGLAISAPVYWMFTKLLSINLPGLTGTGWL
jgi:putative tricarboxylic transport membrane protein